MKREPDNNRIKRAMEHIKAAITNIDSIKWIDRAPSEELFLEEVKEHLLEECRVLESLSNGESE